MKINFIIFCILVVSLQGFADPIVLDEEPIELFKVVTEIPKTSLLTLKKSFSREAVGPWLWIAGTTAVSYHYDRDWLDEVQRFGRSSGIGNEENTKTVLSIGELPVVRLPSDTGSALYFLGDGWTHFGIAGGFYLAGRLKHSHRAVNTALRLVHGMTVSTLFNQAIKRATGRESPSEATEERGKWRPFPSIKAYGENTPKYDAFPSGHVMTATLTFTIINTSYPEYSHVTVPLGGVWVTLLGLQMMNNGVHWASDYPLAIAMGYLMGKTSALLGKSNAASSEDQASSVHFFPSEFAETPTLNLVKSF